MNDYREVKIKFTPCNEMITDIAASLLADVGYESFVAEGNVLTAYIPAGKFDREVTQAVFDAFPVGDVGIEFDDFFIEGRDWNSEWEKNYFKPIVVGEECVIHSTFHVDIPQCRYDIVIDPKMAFGTGHHSTTSLIIRRLLDMDVAGKYVMDMGTGTGILAILAAMRGAAKVDAVEIDEFAHANALENVALNNHAEISIALGDASCLPKEASYDLFVANINRNVITADMCSYARALRSGGDMLLSGFYVEDIGTVEAAASAHGLDTVGYTEDKGWVCLHLRKNK